jgi:hypothetical protein
MKSCVLKFLLNWCCSGVSGEGCGVTVKGDAPVPVADTKASLASPFLSAYSDVCLPLHYLTEYHIVSYSAK